MGKTDAQLNKEAIPFKIFATNSVNIGLYRDLIQLGLPTYDLDYLVSFILCIVTRESS